MWTSSLYQLLVTNAVGLCTSYPAIFTCQVHTGSRKTGLRVSELPACLPSLRKP